MDLKNSWYQKSAGKEISDLYIDCFQRKSEDYFKLLHKYNRLHRKADGDIYVDINFVDLFVIYMVEYAAYLKECLLFLSKKDGILDSDDCHNQLETISDTILYQPLSQSSDENSDLNSVIGKHIDYGYFAESEDLCGYSIRNIRRLNTRRERLAGIFTDYVVVEERERRFIDYGTIGDKAFTNDMLFVKDLFGFALLIYDEIQTILQPYIDGTIENDREKRGLCPVCGGEYKNSKCSTCGTLKKKTEQRNEKTKEDFLDFIKKKTEK